MIQVLLLETIYMLLVTVPSFLIFLKTKKLYDFSRQKGIGAFSSAFLFLALGFLARYALMVTRIFNEQYGVIKSFTVLTAVMEFLLVLPGFLFFYSLIWKKMPGTGYAAYLFSAVIALVDNIMQAFTSMYLSQIALFFLSAMLTYRKSKNNYMRLFSISMALFLVVWVLNFIAQYTIEAVPVMRILTYMITAAVCYTLLYVVFRLTRNF